MKKIFMWVCIVTIFLQAEEVPLSLRGGIYHTPVTLNDSVRLDFVVDSGASMVLLPIDVFSTLLRTGTIHKLDILGTGRASTASGETVETTDIIIKKLQIGNRVIHNVRASVSGVESSLLLGQTALQKLEPWYIDSRRRVLHIGDLPSSQVSYIDYPTVTGITRKEILSFIDKYISRGNSRDLQGVISLYSDRVDYFRAGNVSKQFIYKDKVKYYKRWPSMQVTFLSLDSIQDVPGKPNEKVARYTIDFDVYNYQTNKGIKGRAINTIKIQRVNGKLKIISDKQKVLSRRKY
jgi:hypothetical protein